VASGHFDQAVGIRYVIGDSKVQWPRVAVRAALVMSAGASSEPPEGAQRELYVKQIKRIPVGQTDGQVASILGPPFTMHLSYESKDQ
jgi:hypothetical protein